MASPAIKAPKINLNGREYTANKPKVGIWRKIIKFNNNIGDKNIATDEEAYNELLSLLVEGFNNPEVTAESIEAGLDIDRLMPAFQDMSRWIGNLVADKAAQLPNGPDPAGG